MPSFAMLIQHHPRVSAELRIQQHKGISSSSLLCTPILRHHYPLLILVQGFFVFFYVHCNIWARLLGPILRLRRRGTFFLDLFITFFLLCLLESLHMSSYLHELRSKTWNVNLKWNMEDELYWEMDCHVRMSQDDHHELAINNIPDRVRGSGWFTLPFFFDSSSHLRSSEYKYFSSYVNIGGRKRKKKPYSPPSCPVCCWLTKYPAPSALSCPRPWILLLTSATASSLLASI